MRTHHWDDGLMGLILCLCRLVCQLAVNFLGYEEQHIFLESGPIGDNDLWYHHIPGTFCSLSLFSPYPPSAIHLALRPSQLASGPSQLTLRPSQLALSSSQRALRPTHLGLMPSQCCRCHRGSPSSLRGPTNGIQGPPS